ncbi:ABC transporter permease subunit [Amedibacillus sp. YH-ame6]
MKNRGFNGLKILICVFLLLSVVFPLVTLLLNININDIKEVTSSAQFGGMITNSLIATTIATIFSVSIAFALAWCVNRSNIRYKSIFSMLFTLPMLIPSISHGMGLVLLFGDNGLITNFLGVNIGLYGFPGIIIGSVLYSFPVAFLMLTDIFKYEDYTTYEAAQVLGLSKKQQLLTITLPNMKGALISVIFAVFTMIFTDYGVPLVVGGKIMTLPVYMYREVIGLLDFSKGAIIGVILLVPAFIAFILDFKNENGGNSSTVTKAYQIQKNKKRDLFSYIVCAMTVFLVSLPIIAFIVLSFVKQYPIDMSFSLANVQDAFNLGVGMYLKNSLAIALVTSLFGVCVIYFTAYITARSKRTFSNAALHLIAMVSLAIPGVVLGLCYVIFFKGSFIYGTIMILILVNTIHFFASPYLVAYNSLSKFNENLEDISVSMGISKIRMLLDVYVPCTKETIIEMFSYLFVNSMVTISAISFLANFRNMPLALLIPQFDSQSLIEATAFISVIILFVNGILKLCIYVVKRYARKLDDSK